MRQEGATWVDPAAPHLRAVAAELLIAQAQYIQSSDENTASLASLESASATSRSAPRRPTAGSRASRTFGNATPEPREAAVCRKWLLVKLRSRVRIPPSAFSFPRLAGRFVKAKKRRGAVSLAQELAQLVSAVLGMLGLLVVGPLALGIERVQTARLAGGGPLAPLTSATRPSISTTGGEFRRRAA